MHVEKAHCFKDKHLFYRFNHRRLLGIESWLSNGGKKNRDKIDGSNRSTSGSGGDGGSGGGGWGGSKRRRTATEKTERTFRHIYDPYLLADAHSPTHSSASPGLRISACSRFMSRSSSIISGDVPPPPPRHATSLDYFIGSVMVKHLRTHKSSTYFGLSVRSNCFRGNECLRFLSQSGLAKTRHDAHRMINRLLSFKIVHHVSSTGIVNIINNIKDSLSRSGGITPPCDPEAVYQFDSQFVRMCM